MRISVNWKVLMISVGLAAPIGGRAGRPTAMLTLGGTVYRAASVSVTPQNSDSVLDLNRGENDRALGLLIERSNDKGSCTVFLSSAGAGATGQPALNSSDAAHPERIPYGLKFGGKKLRWNHGSAVLISSVGRTQAGGNGNLLTATIPPTAGAAANSYSDRLTLTVRQN